MTLAQLAAAMGWTLYGPEGDYDKWKTIAEADEGDSTAYVRPDGNILRYKRGTSSFDRGYRGHSIIWNPLVHHDQLLAVRESVAQRELQVRWTEELCKLLGIGSRTWYPTALGIYDAWTLINATPEQQCRAFLRAYGVEDV